MYDMSLVSMGLWTILIHFFLLSSLFCYQLWPSELKVPGAKFKGNSIQSCVISWSIWPSHNFRSASSWMQKFCVFAAVFTGIAFQHLPTTRKNLRQHPPSCQLWKMGGWIDHFQEFHSMKTHKENISSSKKDRWVFSEHFTFWVS